MTKGDIVTRVTPYSLERRQAFFLTQKADGLAEVVLDNGGIVTVHTSLIEAEERGPLTLVSMIVAGVWSFLVGVGGGWWIGS